MIISLLDKLCTERDDYRSRMGNHILIRDVDTRHIRDVLLNIKTPLFKCSSDDNVTKREVCQVHGRHFDNFLLLFFFFWLKRC